MTVIDGELEVPEDGVMGEVQRSVLYRNYQSQVEANVMAALNVVESLLSLPVEGGSPDEVEELRSRLHNCYKAVLVWKVGYEQGRG